MNRGEWTLVNPVGRAEHKAVCPYCREGRCPYCGSTSCAPGVGTRCCPDCSKHPSPEEVSDGSD